MSSNEITPEHFDERIRALFQAVIVRSQPKADANLVARALLSFLVRSCCTWNSIGVLSKSPAGEGAKNDTCALLRCVWDAYLQAAYIVHEPAESTSRAELYFDFDHVERYQMFQRVSRHANDFTKSILSSPARAAGEPRLKANFDRVRSKFERMRGGRVRLRSTWYPGDLAAIAAQLGKTAEYEILLYHLHGSVHSSPRTVMNGPVISIGHVADWSTFITARIAQLNVEFNELELPAGMPEVLQALAGKDFFQLSSRTSRPAD